MELAMKTWMATWNAKYCGASLEECMKEFPMYSKGEMMWLRLELHIRQRIYEYHALHYAEIAKAKGLPKIPRPLQLACKTFHREIRGLALSNKAIFTNENSLPEFIAKTRQISDLRAWMSFIVINLAPADSQIKAIEPLRALLENMRKHFKFIESIILFVRYSDRATFDTIRSLVKNGTFNRFQSLEKIEVRDFGLMKRYIACTQQTRRQMQAKIDLWLAQRRLEPKGTDADEIAEGMMRMRSLNGWLKGKMEKGRKDSVVDTKAAKFAAAWAEWPLKSETFGRYQKAQG